jgi:hypothetical protein
MRTANIITIRLIVAELFHADCKYHYYPSYWSRVVPCGLQILLLSILWERTDGWTDRHDQQLTVLLHRQTWPAADSLTSQTDMTSSWQSHFTDRHDQQLTVSLHNFAKARKNFSSSVSVSVFRRRVRRLTYSDGSVLITERQFYCRIILCRNVHSPLHLTTKRFAVKYVW